MIRKMLMGLLIVTMTVDSLCAMQTAKRIGYVGAQALAKSGRMQPKVAGRVLGLDVLSAQQTAALSAMKDKQRYQKHESSKLHSLGCLASAGAGAALALFHAEKKEQTEKNRLAQLKVQAEKDRLESFKRARSAGFNARYNWLGIGVLLGWSSSEKMPTMDEFFAFSHQEQQEFVITLIQKEYLSLEEQRIVYEIYKNGRAQLKDVIGSFIDYIHLEKYGRYIYGWHICRIALDHVTTLDEAKQKEIANALMQKKEMSIIDEAMISQIYTDGTAQLKEFIGSFIDYIHLEKYGYVYGFLIRKIALDHVTTLDEVQQKEIASALMQKKEMSVIDEVMISQIHSNGTAQLKEFIWQQLITHRQIDCIHLEKYEWYIQQIAKKHVTTLDEVQQKEIASALMQKKEMSVIDEAMINQIHSNGTAQLKEFIWQQLITHRQIDYIHLEKYEWYIQQIALDHVTTLDEVQQKEIASALMQKKEKIYTDQRILSNIYTNGTAQLKDLVKKAVGVPSIFSDIPNGKAPTKICAEKHLDRLILYNSLPQPLQELVEKMAKYQEEEMKKGQLVVFNGQQSIRALYAQIAKKLYENKYKVLLDDNATMVRYFANDTLDEAKRKELSKTGIVGSRKDRPYLVFANIDALGNASNPGSCTIQYIADNMDQKWGNSDFLIDEIFSQYGFKEELKKVKADNPVLIQQLIDLQRQISKYGTLISFSLPLGFLDDSVHIKVHQGSPEFGIFSIKDLHDMEADVDEYIYPSISGGSLQQYEGMQRVSDILNNMHQMPSSHEYCIPVGKEMADPLLAKAKGIKIRQWFVEPDLEKMAERDALIDQIIAGCVAMKTKK